MKTTMIRLNKYLAQCGLGSRRKCDQLIKTGKITINGKLITKLSYLVNEEKDKVAFDGNLLSRTVQPTYILLNKPAGYITTVNDELGRNTVIDLIPIVDRIFPVGRLDKDTEGLLLLTNDGDLSYHLTHPKFLVKKVYQVKLTKSLTAIDLKKLEQGLMLEDGVTAPCEIKYVKSDKLNRTLKISIHEGKKRQVKRMFRALGYSVICLRRIQFANLTLTNLPTGKWRYLTDMEIKKLKNNYS